jgi:cobalt transporter subunit CbtA
LTHFAAGSTASGASDGHDHTHDTSEPAVSDPAKPVDGSIVGADDHDGAMQTSSLLRNGLTVLFMILIYTSYAMLLVAGFGLMGSMGHQISPKEGALWGIAGFMSFQLAPALGLAPELPGTIAAELGARQIWWWSTVACTATGLGLLAYGRQSWAFAVAVALLALPHVIGAPETDGFFGVAPPEVAAAFSARVLGTGLMVWACLGAIAGHFWSKSTTV